MILKVLLVITGLEMGGAEHVVVNLADELAQRGYRVKIVYLLGPANMLPVDPDIEIIPLGMTGNKSVISAYIKLKNIIKDFEPDVVHSHMVHANLLTRLVRLTQPIPRLVCTAHSNNEGGKFRMLAYRLTDPLADISTNVSDQAVAEFIIKGAAKANRMVSVPNGVNTNKFYFNNKARQDMRHQLGVDNKKVILAVGNLHAAKDYPTLLQAVFLLKQHRQDFIVLVAGTGHLEDELKQLAIRLGISDDIVFLGVRRDIPALMSAADVFALSSAWEGFGLVVAEAMACERVVVATDSGGVKEVVADAGMVIPIKNAPALSDALARALSLDANQAALMGAMARERVVTHYSINTMVEDYLTLYLPALNGVPV